MQGFIFRKYKNFFFDFWISLGFFWLQPRKCSTWLLKLLLWYSPEHLCHLTLPFIFSNVYISAKTIFECFYIFLGWKRGHQLSSYATVWGMGVIQNAYRCIQGEMVSRLICTYAPFHVLAVFSSYSVLFYLQKFDFTFILKSCVCQKRLVFPNELNFCRHKICFFT